MSRLVDASGEVLRVTSYPFPQAGELLLWIRPTWSSGDNQHHIILRMGDAPNYFEISKFYVGGQNNLYCGWAKGASFSRVVTADAELFTAGCWTSILIRWKSTGVKDVGITIDRWVWNQTLGAEAIYAYSTDALQNSDLSALALNVGNADDAGSYPAAGEVANVAIWNDIDAYGADWGVSPALKGGQPFRRNIANLQDYWPLWGDDSPEPNWGWANPTRTLTVTNATKGVSDPNVGPFRMGFNDCAGSIFLPSRGGNFWPVITRMVEQQRA